MHVLDKIFLRLFVLSLFLLPNIAGGQGSEQKKQVDGSDTQRHFVIVSKTHFDIGYSALARDVVKGSREGIRVDPTAAIGLDRGDSTAGIAEQGKGELVP